MLADKTNRCREGYLKSANDTLYTRWAIKVTQGFYGNGFSYIFLTCSIQYNMLYRNQKNICK